MTVLPFSNTSDELTAFKNAVFRIRNCVIITTNDKGKITGFNHCAENIFGYTLADVQGKPLTGILFPDKTEQLLKNSERTKKVRFKSFVTAILKAGESEQKVYSADGQELLVIFSVEHILLNSSTSGYIFSGFDVSEQRRIENAFEGIELFNEKILSTTPTVLYLYDLKDQQIVFSNRNFHSFLYYSDAEASALKNTPLSSLLHPDDVEKRRIYRETLAASNDGDIIEGEFRLRNAFGAWQWIQNRDTVFTRNDDGSAALILGAALDISERKAYEEALNEANDQLNSTNLLLTDANNLKTELLGIAAHDLKNPLSVIKNLSSILEENSQEDVTELASVIRQAAQQMLALINELLESSALESGKYPMHIENVDMTVLLDYVLKSNIIAAQRKSQNIVTKAEPKCIIMADGSSMRRVLDNLISNAIKYSPLKKDIYISLLKTDNGVRLEVRDQGPGLNEEDKTKLFGKFQRLNAQPTGGESSSGLGLSIVKQIVDIHHGSVWAESEGAGKGTTFIVQLPFRTE